MHSFRTHLIVFIFFLSVFTLFSSGHYGGDGLENYLAARSMVTDRDLSIHDAGFDVAEMRYKERGKIGAGGKRYSPHGVGMPVLLVPFYFLGYIISSFFGAIPSDYITQFFVSFTNPMVCAFTALTVIMLLDELGYTPRTSFIAAAISSFCTMNFIYARSGFSEPAVGLCFILAAFFVLKLYKTDLFRWVFFSGVFFGYAVFIKKSYLLYIVCFILAIISYAYDNKDLRKAAKGLVLFAVPLLFYLGLVLFFNRIRYGGLFNTEYGTLGDMVAMGATPVKYFKAFVYFLFSSGKGYFLFNVPLLLSLWGIKDSYKRNAMFARFILSVVLLNTGFHIYMFDRGTLFSWGPRHMFLTIPFMAVLLAGFIENAKDLSRKISVWTLSILGFLVQLPVLFMNSSKWLFFLKEKLNVEEYMINYIPDISPLKGAWCLLLSFLNRTVTGKSMSFVFDPDHKFIRKTVASMSGYDVLDVWWANAVKVYPQLAPYAIFSVLLLIFTIYYSFSRLKAVQNLK